MVEKSQDKNQCFIFTGATVYMEAFFIFFKYGFIISRRALVREGDYEMMSVCACVRACVR